MVEQRHEPILTQILELLDTACQASLELLEYYSSGEAVDAAQLLDDLRAVIGAVHAAQSPLLPQLEYAYTVEMLENVEDTLDDIQRSVEGGDREQALMKIELQLFPFLRQLKELFYFWGSVYPDKERMERYYREEFAAHYQNYYVQGGETPHCKATVIIVAYNHLEMTKECVESVLRYTDFDGLNAQLVLVDHGSSDGTLEYFEQLGVGQVIHYKANMRGTMFCALPQICNSEYYVHVANDTVVTKDWLDILLKCADSDPKIAMVSPATCNLSNFQSLNVPTNDRDELLKLAEISNASDPRLWSERARVLPAIGVFRLEVLNQIGFWDPLFYTFDFMDDDFSLRARRGGYRQVLCEDVMCYHRGSATVKDTQQMERTLEDGRGLFFQKHGVDAWGNGFCYDRRLLRGLDISADVKGTVNILGIDCGFGDNTLQIRNLLRRTGIDAKCYHITTDKTYYPDLQPQSEDAVLTVKEELISSILECFPGVSFSYLCIGEDLDRFPDPDRLLAAVSSRTELGGQLVFCFQNPYFAVRVRQLLQFALPEPVIHLLSPEHLVAAANRYFSKMEAFGVSESLNKLDEFIVRHYGEDFLASGTKVRLEISHYYVRCVK